MSECLAYGPGDLISLLKDDVLSLIERQLSKSQIVEAAARALDGARDLDDAKRRLVFSRKIARVLFDYDGVEY
jgi:hypothetical protein